MQLGSVPVGGVCGSGNPNFAMMQKILTHSGYGIRQSSIRMSRLRVAEDRILYNQAGQRRLGYSEMRAQTYDA